MGVLLVVDVLLAEGGVVLAVQAERALASGHDDVAFVELEPHRAADVSLGGGDEGVQGLPQLAEPQAVVDEFGVLDRDEILVAHGVLVQADALQGLVGAAEDRAGRGLVDAAAFHADQAVFDDVGPADAVPAAERVQLGEEPDTRDPLAVQADGVALLEFDLDVLRRVRRLFRADRELVHLLLGLVPGVFEDAALVGEVKDIAVAAVDVLFSLRDRDVVLLGIADGILAALDFPLAPGGDDLELGIQGHDGELEAHLVVALAGAAVGDRLCTLGLGGLDEFLGDQGPGHGGAEQVIALVDRTGLHGGEDVILQEFLPQVFDDELARAGGDGFFIEAAQILVLTQVGREADDLTAAVVVLEPGHDHRCVQSAAVRQHHLLYLVRCHCAILPEIYVDS